MTFKDLFLINFVKSGLAWRTNAYHNNHRFRALITRVSKISVQRISLSERLHSYQKLGPADAQSSKTERSRRAQTTPINSPRRAHSSRPQSSRRITAAGRRDAPTAAPAARG